MPSKGRWTVDREMHPSEGATQYRSGSRYVSLCDLIVRLRFIRSGAEEAVCGLVWDLEREGKLREAAKAEVKDWTHLWELLHYARCGHLKDAITEAIAYFEGFLDGFHGKE